MQVISCDFQVRQNIKMRNFEILFLGFLVGAMGINWPLQKPSKLRLPEDEVERDGREAIVTENEWSLLVSKAASARLQHDLYLRERSAKDLAVSEVEVQQMQEKKTRFSINLKHSKPPGSYSMPVQVGKQKMQLDVATGGVGGPFGSGNL
jgi:hypothetical protein